MNELSKRKTNRLNSKNQNGLLYSERNGSTLKDQTVATKITECCHTTSKYGLHRYNCLPKYLQFNRFVRTGYRINLTTWECLKSLLYCHNETFNIYSHGLACLLFILIGPFVYHEAETIQLYPFLYSIHYVAAILCVLCSAVYHLMMCHGNGAKTYDKLIKMDLIGIWFVSTFGPTAFIYGTFFCYVWLYRIIILIYCVMAFTGLLYVTRGTNAAERLRPIICLGIIRFPLYSTRGYMAWQGYTTGQISVIWLLVAMELFALLGSTINVNRFPEKWSSWNLDYVGNSHNIMHIIVLICPFLLHFATVADFKWMENVNCPR